MIFATPVHAAARSVTLLGDTSLSQRIGRDVGGLYKIVDGDVYRSAAEQKGRSALSADNVHEVASGLRIDAVIDSEIKLVNGKNRLLTSVREARTGRVLGGGSYDLDSLDDAVCDLIFALDAVDPVSRPPEDSDRE